MVKGDEKYILGICEKNIPYVVYTSCFFMSMAIKSFDRQVDDVNIITWITIILLYH